MKKITALLLSLALCLSLAACSAQPRTYEFYSGFSLPAPQTIEPRDTEGYTDITNREYNACFRKEMGMDSIASHSIFKQKNAVIANFNINKASQITVIRNYAYETFWQGNFHFITGGLPYEDWQHKIYIKTLYVQLWDATGENLLLQDVYIFDGQELSGFKAFRQTTYIDETRILPDQNVDLAALLAIEPEQIPQWLDIDRYAGKEYMFDVRTSLLGTEAVANIITEKQLPPENLAGLYTQLGSKLAALSPNLTVNLYYGDDARLYYSYSSTEGLPLPEQNEK